MASKPMKLGAAPRKIKHLTPEQKKAVWGKPKSNLGLGWWSGEPADPIKFEQGGSDRGI